MSEQQPHLLVERSDGVMTLTMNRVETRNALSPQMLVFMDAGCCAMEMYTAAPKKVPQRKSAKNSTRIIGTHPASRLTMR